MSRLASAKSRALMARMSRTTKGGFVARAGVTCHHQRPAFAKLRQRSNARSRLGACVAARSGFHRSRTYSAIIKEYSGPTFRESPAAGTMPSRIALLLECLASAISRAFGSRSSSGVCGMIPIDKLRKRASAWRSASNHASIARTAILKHIPGAGSGRKSFERIGAHSTRSRSHSANQNDPFAAWLILLKFVSKAGRLLR